MRTRETRIRLFMQMEFEAYRNELDWLIVCFLCAVNDYLEEYCPPMPSPIPSLLPYKFGKEGGNGSGGHIAGYSEDDSEKVISAASFATSGNSIVLVIADVH